MKAAQINQYGGVEVIGVTEVEKPSLKEDQILVEVYTASINPADYKLREGAFKQYAPLQFPATLGGDFAGVVTQLGEGVSEFKVGDEVFGSSLILNGGSGAFAQILSANTKNSALKPQSLDFTQAAALPLVGSSAVQALEEHIKLQSGQRILIHGGAGGIGHIAIQLAKSLGCYVATTVGTDDMDFVKGLGTDEIIDYQTQDFSEILKDFDAVFDTVGGDVTEKSFKVLKKGGTIVSMLGQPNPDLAKHLGVTAIGQNTETNTVHLSRVRELVDKGQIKVHVDKVFPLEKVQEAFKYLEEDLKQGKVVLKIKD